MTKYDISTLAARLMGIYAWLQSLGYFGAFSTVFANPDSSQRAMVSVSLLGPALLLALAGSLLFIGSERVARLLTTSAPNEPSDSPAPKTADLQMVAFSVVGLTCAVFTLPEVTRYLTGVMLSSPFYAEGLPVRTRLLGELPQMISVVVRLIIGLALFVRPQPVLAWWTRRQLLSATPSA